MGESLASYTVDGMTCNGCVASVTRALERAGLSATVSLAERAATIAGPHDPEKVRAAVEGAGFDFGGPRGPEVSGAVE